MQYPPDTRADARNRAWRTFMQGLLVDVTAAVTLAVGPALTGSDFAWSRTYWATLAALAAKTALTSAVAYLARRIIPPAI